MPIADSKSRKRNILVYLFACLFVVKFSSSKTEES